MPEHSISAEKGCQSASVSNLHWPSQASQGALRKVSDGTSPGEQTMATLVRQALQQVLTASSHTGVNTWCTDNLCHRQTCYTEAVTDSFMAVMHRMSDSVA